MLPKSQIIFQFSEDDDDTELKDILDMKRSQEEEDYRDKEAGNFTERVPTVNTKFQGHGTLIVVKETVNDRNPLCMGLEKNGNGIQLVPCFRSQVVGTLAPDWATGAVIEEEVVPNSRWEVGPCSSDGSLEWR